MVTAFRESQVVRLWQDCLPGRTDLVTEDGRPVAVVYPGRPNDDRGADLRDAIIATGGRLQKGDIEVHVRSSGWWGHRHHQNPLFNKVILHVVYWYDTTAAVTLQNGRRVPTLALARYIGEAGAGAAKARRPMPCHAIAGRRGEDITGGILEAAGDRRLANRVADLRAELSRGEADQVLYRGIMGALGYTKNKLPMLELARRMPIARLNTVAGGAASREECLARYQALLLGTAGLLPSQQAGRYGERDPSRGWVDRLEEIWAARGKGAAMSPDDWHSFKVRPGNLPRRRIAAMSYLLRRYREEGLRNALVGELENAVPGPGRGTLTDWLLVDAGGYWGGNIDIGLPAGRTVPALLGRNRAEIIAVNVLLPLAVAWGQRARPDMAARALELYRNYPATAENTLEKHMRRQLGISRLTVGTARRQQGIIHIYKTLCSQGKCAACPLK